MTVAVMFAFVTQGSKHALNCDHFYLDLRILAFINFPRTAALEKYELYITPSFLLY